MNGITEEGRKKMGTHLVLVKELGPIFNKRCKYALFAFFLILVKVIKREEEES